MDKILAPIKQRILQIIDFKEVERTKFFKILGLASSNFRGNALYSEVGGDVIAKILAEFPDINANWLLTGRESMLKEEQKHSINQTIEGNNNTISGKDTLTHSDSSEDKATIKELKKRIAEYEKKLEEKDKQISKLINVIEKLNSI